MDSHHTQGVGQARSRTDKVDSKQEVAGRDRAGIGQDQAMNKQGSDRRDQAEIRARPGRIRRDQAGNRARSGREQSGQAGIGQQGRTRQGSLRIRLQGSLRIRQGRQGPGRITQNQAAGIWQASGRLTQDQAGPDRIRQGHAGPRRIG